MVVTSGIIILLLILTQSPNIDIGYAAFVNIINGFDFFDSLRNQILELTEGIMIQADAFEG